MVQASRTIDNARKRGGQLLDVCAYAPGINDRIGAKVAGRRSDIASLDLDHPNLVSLTDPVNQIVHAENGRTVDNVMVGGRLVLDGGRFSMLASRPYHLHYIVCE